MATPPVFSAGAVLTAAQMNAVGLWLVKSQTVGSAVSSQQVTGAFNADFTNYRIVVSNVDFSVADNAIAFTLGSSTATYYSASRYFSLAGGTIEVNRNNAASAFLLASATNNDNNFSFDVFQPYATQYTSWSGSGFTYIYNTSFGGLHAVASSHTSFTIATTAGTMTGGTIKVYGYRD